MVTVVPPRLLRPLRLLCASALLVLTPTRFIKIKILEQKQKNSEEIGIGSERSPIRLHPFFHSL